MISTLQPQRPRVVAAAQVQQPLIQQPSRSVSSMPITSPRSQVEAMPPFSASMPRNSLAVKQFQAFQLAQQQSMLDPSRTHPVFFTKKLKKAPNGVLCGGGSGTPIADGYVYENGERRKATDGAGGSARL